MLHTTLTDQKRGYLQYSTMVNAGIWFIFTKKKYFETVIRRTLNCTFQTSSMVSTMSKYQFIYRKILTFSPPDFLKMTIFRKKISQITCSPFDMTMCDQPGNLLNFPTKLFHLFPLQGARTYDTSLNLPWDIEENIIIYLQRLKT